MTTIPGYTHDQNLQPSPVSLHDLELLKQTVLWSDEDSAALKLAGTILDGQVEAILDVWYGFVTT